MSSTSGASSAQADSIGNTTGCKDGSGHCCTVIACRTTLKITGTRAAVTITPDYVFRVGERLRQEFNNGRSYYSLDGVSIELPAHEPWRSSKEFLDWHEQTVFKR